MKMRIGPISWCVLSAALFGLSPAFCKILLGENVGALALASLLYLGAGLGTLPFSFRKASVSPKPSETRRLALAVLFGGVLGPICLMIGLQQSDAGSVALLLNFESVATVLLGWLFFKEHVSRSVFIASLLVVFGGVWVMLGCCVSFVVDKAVFQFHCITT